MQIYLPIAAMPVDAFVIAGLSTTVGFISGLFGVGGGFLMTPLLIFLGVPSAVAVASVTSQVAAASTTGTLAYSRRKAVDFKLGVILTFGGVTGALLGVAFFNAMNKHGHLDTVIVFCYIVLLGSIGSLMLIESLRALFFTNVENASSKPNAGISLWIERLPLQMWFQHSKLHISLIPLLLVALFVGFAGALLGVGGGFILVPALIYIFRIPLNVVVGTSLLQQLITMLAATLLHAVTNHSVDIVLATVLMIGATLGAQFGARAQTRVRAEYFRLLLGLLVFAVALRFTGDVLIAPADPFTATRTVVKP